MSEADEVHEEVERRKRRARELQLPSLLFELYRDLICHYPAWSVDHRQYIPDDVAALEQPAEGAISFIYRGNKYSFSWGQEMVDSTFDDSPEQMLYYNGFLNVHVAGQRVFTLTLRGESDMGITWEPRNIEAFIEGPWVEALRTLAQTAKDHLRTARNLEAKKWREDAGRLADLKERFGIK